MHENTRLSENFSLRELLASEQAERRPTIWKQQLDPPEEVIGRLRYLTQTVLQPLRDELGWPIRISSGYRCPELNELIGGSPKSQHVLGEAADIQLANPSGFMTSEKTVEVRAAIQMLYQRRSGKHFPPQRNAHFYVFALVAMDLDIWDTDQIIHEFGPAWGQPAWVHMAASTRQDRRRITVVGSYTGRKYVHHGDLAEAVAHWEEDHGFV